MKIRLENCGAIESIDVDVSKKLNVIIGRNGVNKTYLSTFIYGTMESAFGLGSFFDRNKVKIIIENMIKKKDIEKEINFNEILKKNQKNQKNKNKDILNHFLEHIFSLGNNNKIFEELNFSYENLESFSNYLKNIDFKTEIRNEILFSSRKKFDILKIKILDLEEVKDSLDIIADIICRQLNKLIFKTPFFFPAERGAVNIFNRELFIKKINLLDRIYELKNRKNKDRFEDSLKKLINEGKKYTLPVRENLEFANNIEEISKRDGRYVEIANEIEKELLEGSIKVNKNTGQITFAHNKSKDKRVTLDMSASSVKSLVGLILFLKHKAKKDMTIFIDEPELNLHPDMQVKIARVFVKMINSGLKVFISTHSDYIARELNNMIIANEVKDVYPKELRLNKKDINVTRIYYKNKTDKKLITEYVEVEKDGFAIPSIDEVITEQNNNNDILLDKLYNNG